MYLKTKRTIYWLIIAILLFANALILIYRNDGFKYFPYKTYSQLYVTDSSLYLQHIYFDADSLALSFSQTLPAAGYCLMLDSDTCSIPILPQNKVLRMPLKENSHIYRLVPREKKEMALVVQADHSKTESGYTNEFIFCNLPGPDIKVSPYEIWRKGTESFSNNEISSGNDFLAKNTHALSAVTDSARVIEVCRLVSTLRPAKNGMKAATVSLLQPYKQLQLAAQHRVNLDCGNYSAMICYLCSLLHIANRVVTFAGPDGNWRYGVHYYNEVYLREKQQWVLCDGVSNAYMPHDSLRYYNAADVYKMAHTNSFTGKLIYIFRNDSLAEVPYAQVNYWHHYYNRNNANICYLHPGTSTQISKWRYLADFYSFDRNFDFYSDVNANDWLRIIIKMGLFCLLVICLFSYAVFENKYISKKVK